MKMLIIQPHRDDAVFSIAEHMLTWIEDGHQLTILTVFGGFPEGEQAQKHFLMEEEHRAAMKALGNIDLIDANYLDHAARHGSPMGPGDVLDTLRFGLGSSGADVVVGPTGIHHDDHQIVRSAVEGLPRATTHLWLYDELPYFVMYPEKCLHATLHRLGGWRNLTPEGCRSHRVEKQQLCAMYRSQIGETEERCLLAPERVWRVS